MKTNYTTTAAAIRRHTNRLDQYVGTRAFSLVNARINRLHRLFSKQINSGK
jgi:hypothetical protein